MAQKSANFVRNCVSRYQVKNLRPIFDAARKNIFGRIVTLGFNVDISDGSGGL